MSNKKKTIDCLGRDDLIIIGTKLQIKGYTNKFNSPYLNKNELKKRILENIKKEKKIQRSKSMSDFNSNVGHPKNLKRTQSLPNLSGGQCFNNSNYKSNNNTQTIKTNCIYPLCKCKYW